MAIENRDLSPNQQRDHYAFATGAVGTGGTATLLLVPYPSNLVAAAMFPYGVSNTPTATFDVTRFNAAGATTITGIVTTQTLTGATIPTGFTVSTGVTATQLQANDLITLRLAGTNSNALSTNVMLVLQALQDIKTDFGK